MAVCVCVCVRVCSFVGAPCFSAPKPHFPVQTPRLAFCHLACTKAWQLAQRGTGVSNLLFLLCKARSGEGVNRESAALLSFYPSCSPSTSVGIYSAARDSDSNRKRHWRCHRTRHAECRRGGAGRVTTTYCASALCLCTTPLVYDRVCVCRGEGRWREADGARRLQYR